MCVTGRVALQMKPFLKATLDWRVSKLIFIVETAKKMPERETNKTSEECVECESKQILLKNSFVQWKIPTN